MRQLETNLNFISSMADDPAVTTAALKQEFDKAGNVIKGYINDTLLDDIVDADESTATSVLEDVGEMLEDFEEDIAGEMADFKEEVNGSLATMQGTINGMSGNVNKKVVYGDFATTTTSATPSITPLQDYTGTITALATGYYPLAIAGVHFSRTFSDMQLIRWQITSKANGRAVITYRILNADNTRTLTPTVSIDVLWVKIR